jgi:hypothetical protein
MGDPDSQCVAIDKMERMGNLLDEAEKKIASLENANAVIGKPILAEDRTPQSYVTEMAHKMHGLVDYMEEWTMTGSVHLDMALLGTQAAIYRALSSYNEGVMKLLSDLQEVGTNVKGEDIETK